MGFIATVVGMLVSVSGAQSYSNLNREGVMLDGYDPVSYFKADKPVKGDAKLKMYVNHDVYWFSSEENRTLFVKDTKKYEPQFGGWCAYSLVDLKRKVPGDPLSYLVQDGKLLFFFNGFWGGDTREKWLHFKGRDVQSLYKEAESVWNNIKTREY